MGARTDVLVAGRAVEVDGEGVLGVAGATAAVGGGQIDGGVAGLARFEHDDRLRLRRLDDGRYRLGLAEAYRRVGVEGAELAARVGDGEKHVVHGAVQRGRDSLGVGALAGDRVAGVRAAGRALGVGRA